MSLTSLTSSTSLTSPTSSILILKSVEQEQKVLELIKLMNNSIDGVKTLFDVLGLNLEMLKKFCIKYNLMELFIGLNENLIIKPNNETEYMYMSILYENIDMYHKYNYVNTLSIHTKLQYAIEVNSNIFINYFITSIYSNDLCVSLFLQLITSKANICHSFNYLNKMNNSYKNVHLLNEVIKCANLSVIEKLIGIKIDIDENSIYEAFITKDIMILETIIIYAMSKKAYNLISNVKSRICKQSCQNNKLMYLFDLHCFQQCSIE